jgi:class 3 adenylate cyclase
MFTDMQAFSSLAAVDEDAALDLLSEHNRMMVPIVKRHGGRIIKTLGDSILGTFNLPSDALDAGIEIQQHLKIYNKSLPLEKQIHIRVGVHVGEVVVVKNDILGVVTNLAKRVESLAAVDKVYCTEAVRLTIVVPRYRFHREGIWKPKGSTRKMEIYSVSRINR